MGASARAHEPRAAARRPPKRTSSKRAGRRHAEAEPDVEQLRPYPGPQTAFLRNPAYELGYGGAAGSGKSFCLLLELASEIDDPGYAAIAFRRTFVELQQTLIEESKRLYPGLGGKYDEGKHLWRFPSGARIYFGHLQHASDIGKYKGPEFGRVVFDELTTFLESQYRFMFTRLRRRDGKPCYMRFGTNPGDIGHAFVLRRFAPWIYPEGHEEYDGPLTEEGTKVREEKGLRPHADSGEILWLRTLPDGSEVVCDRFTHEPNCKKKLCVPGKPCSVHAPVSRSFIPARISDNPTYAGSAYEARLYQSDILTRKQLLEGDWLARVEAGLLFKRHWFVGEGRPLLAVIPANVVAWVRYWDRAATEPSDSNPDPDWTVGVLMGLLPDGTFVVADVERFRCSPGTVKARIVAQAVLDPEGTICALEQDPAAAGAFEVMEYVRALAGFDVRCIRPWGAKVARALPASQQAEAGNIRLVRGPWNKPYLDVLEAFGGENVHDDDVDATSGAVRVLTIERERGGRRRQGGVRTVAVAAAVEDDDD